MDKKKLYEKLGAVWFQKVVFKAEKLKFKIIDKFFPNIGERYSARCDKKAEKLIAKAKTEEERKDIIFKYNHRKMLFNRELVEKKNRNYHMYLNNASSFYKYLLSNKKIHVNGIKFNVGAILLSLILLPFASGGWIVALSIFLGYNVLSLGVNFQCINLQNYNICRFDERREQLERLELKRKKMDGEKYGIVGATIYKKLESSVEMPKKEELLKEMTTLEELQQLRSLALEVKRQHGGNACENSEGAKQKVINRKEGL